MVKIRLLVVGKIKESFYRDAVEEYLKRLSRFAKVEVKELSEGNGPEAEADEIIHGLKGHVLALCVEGKKCSSEGFAQKIGKLIDEGKELTFVIGSSCGLSDRVKEASNERISFSDMTFPHHLMRVILVEQIYRAFMILGGGTYHK